MMIKKYLTFGLMATALSACTSNEQSELLLNRPTATAIVNGTPVSASDELAKQVLLLNVKSAAGESWICTATALSKRILLTAAHCLPYDTTSSSVSIIDSQGTAFEIASIKAAIRHEAYESPLNILNYGDNDIALALLKSDLPANIKITSLYEGHGPTEKDDILVAGYGLTEKDPVIDGARGPGKDFHTSLNSGKAIYEDSFNTITLLSADSPAHGCMGDSGGPAFLKTSTGALKQFGVLSRVSSADCLTKNIYESTTAQADWIQYNLKKLNFYQRMSETPTKDPSSQFTAKTSLKGKTAQQALDKVLTLLNNEYIEYVCSSNLKKTEEDSYELFERIVSEIPSTTDITTRHNNNEIEFSLRQIKAEENNAVIATTISTSNNQSFANNIIRESRTLLGKVKTTCQAKFINTIEMK